MATTLAALRHPSVLGLVAAQVVGNDGIQQKQTDFGPSVTKVKASGADALFFGGYSPEAAPLIKQLRDAGWKGTFVVADGVDEDVSDGVFVEVAGVDVDAVESFVLASDSLPSFVLAGVLEVLPVADGSSVLAAGAVAPGVVASSGALAGAVAVVRVTVAAVVDGRLAMVAAGAGGAIASVIILSTCWRA